MVDLFLPIIFFFVALIYSSVGLGGGSAYTSIMAIFGINYLIIPTTSLSLNLIVTFIGMIHFWKNDHGRINLVLPFLLTSVPMTYFAGLLELPELLFKILLLFTLVFVAIRIYFLNDLKISIHLNPVKKWFIIFGLGGILGFISGTVGIGGGIYLVPLIILFGLGTEKEASASGAMFIWVNSLVGVLARNQIGTFDLGFILPLGIATLIGGFFGSYLGAVKFGPKVIQKLMGIVVLIAILVLLKDLFL
jgi:uncharacterized protein